MSKTANGTTHDQRPDLSSRVDAIRDADRKKFRRGVAGISSTSSLTVNSDVLQQAEPCPVCGTTLAETMASYDYTYECNKTTFVTVKKILPGYRCTSCDLEFLDLEIDQRFLKSVGTAIEGLASDNRLLKSVSRKPRDTATLRSFARLPISADASRQG